MSMYLKNRVRFFRNKADRMTQAELAERVNVSRQTIISIEKGKYNPSVELALQIAAVFSIPLEEVFYLEGR